jgi:hypothetical protein
MSASEPITISTETLGKALKFIERLKQGERETSFAMIAALQKPPYDAGFVKIIDKKNRIYEARGSTKDFWIRLFWFYHKIPHQNKSIIVITNGYIKQQNKTDPNEIETATRIQFLYEKEKQAEYSRLKKGKH